MITYFKDEKGKVKKVFKKEALSTILKTVDTFVIIATNATSLALSITGFGLLVLPISTAIASGPLTNKYLRWR